MRMKTRTLTFFLILILCLLSSKAIGREWADIPALLVKKIPIRPYLAMSGSEFAKYVSGMDKFQREEAIRSQLTIGNLPAFLKKLKPVYLRDVLEDGKAITATIFVMPDYLSIGSDRDFLRIPMALSTAKEVANRFGFILPTKKMVDAIFQQSAFHFTPQPMPPGPQMRSTAYYIEHNRKINRQRLALGCPLDALVSGHKKDVVLTNRLVRNREKVAIYGWHNLSGTPIQSLTTIHGAGYADYSHGIRLVSRIALLDGKPIPIDEILQDPKLANLLSDEGAIRVVRQFAAFHYSPPVRRVETSRDSAVPLMRATSHYRELLPP
jgi:hypothetical protein